MTVYPYGRLYARTSGYPLYREVIVMPGLIYVLVAVLLLLLILVVLGVI